MKQPLDATAYKRALQRIEDLAGCLENTPEEQELIALSEAVETFEEALLELVALMPRDQSSTG